MKHVLRPVPLGAAFAVLASAIVVTAHFETAWWLIAFGVFGPDLSFLAAFGQPAGGVGKMPTRAVKSYNLAHHPAGPILALTVGAMLRSPTLGALSLAWASHLLWDRGVGYGKRAGDGSIIATPVRRTHIVLHLAHGDRHEPGSHEGRSGLRSPKTAIKSDLDQWSSPPALVTGPSYDQGKSIHRSVFFHE